MLLLPLLLLAPAADPPKGWPELFPELGNFTRKIEAPIVGGKDIKAKVYSQSASYNWSGGRFEVITITIARDPAFEDLFAEGAIKKLPKEEKRDENPRPIPKAGDPSLWRFPYAPTTTAVGKMRAYLWDVKDLTPGVGLRHRLVVVLAADTVAIIDQQGGGTELATVAEKLDFAKVVKALEAPPPTAKKE